MLYTSYLLHYDVKETDFGASATFGNKMAILAGDFLLARSSLALSELRSAECIELMATCIANLAEGEFMQLQSPDEKEPDEKKAFDYYMDKIYLKTGSLIAQSCKASAVLSGCTTDISNSAYAYGRHLGIAFQVANIKRERETGLLM
jgi:hexaprenyl-diphosphate synthase